MNHINLNTAIIIVCIVITVLIVGTAAFEAFKRWWFSKEKDNPRL